MITRKPKQIRDRVARGDDKFRLETLPDGRVRLIPAPDELQQDGTDVNAALMQPWEDLYTAATNNGDVRLEQDEDGSPVLRVDDGNKESVLERIIMRGRVF